MRRTFEVGLWLACAVTLLFLALPLAAIFLRISPAEFDEVAAELARTLDAFNVPAAEKDEVLAAFAAHKAEVTEGYAATAGARRT